MREICTLRSTVHEAAQRKRGATDRPDLRVWRRSASVVTGCAYPNGLGNVTEPDLIYLRLLM